MAEEFKSGLTILERFFEGFEREESFLILTHDHPDPDSIASAAALNYIAKVLATAKTTIAYGGMIGRSENAHMVKYLHLKLRPIDRIRFSDYSKIALVDTQPRTGNNALPKSRVADLVIDHHPMIKPTRRVPFADIRTEYGATATILAEYLFHFDLPIDRNLATALLYAIKSETQDLGREAGNADSDCYLKLFPIANKRLLAKIVNSRVRRTYYQWLKEALESAHIVGNAIVTQLAEVDTPDIIPEIADLLLRMQGAVWTFCIGAHDGAIYLSIRTTNLHKNAGALMKRLVRGKGTGGGHGQIAGGKILVKDLEPWQIHELQLEVEQDFLRLIRREDKAKVPLIEEPEASGGGSGL